MLEVSQAVRDAIVGKAMGASANAMSNIVTFVLVSIEWTEEGSRTPLFTTDAGRNVTYMNYDAINSDRTFEPGGGLKAVSPPRTEGAGAVDRDMFTVTLGDFSGIYRATLLTQSVGTPVTVELGFLNADGTLLQERLPVYRGQIAYYNYNIMDDEPDIVITCTGPLTKLRQVTNRLTTEDSQKREHPRDRAFDFSYDTQNEATLRWGPGGD